MEVADTFRDKEYLEEAVEAEVEEVTDLVRLEAEVAEVLRISLVQTQPQEEAVRLEVVEDMLHTERMAALDPVSSLLPGNGGIKL